MRLETPLIELAREHVAIVNGRPDMRVRYAVYDLPGGITPCITWAEPSSEGTEFAVFLSRHPERLLVSLLQLYPHEILSHFRPEEICDAYIVGMIEHDGTFHTQRSECTERGESDLLLATSVLQARKTKRLAIGEAEDTASASN